MWIWEWKSKPLFVSENALEELTMLNWSMENVFGVLEEGYDCTTAEERNKDKLALCLKMKGGIYRVVVGESYSLHYKCNCWVLVHVKQE
jgi:hypothetical protein